MFLRFLVFVATLVIFILFVDQPVATYCKYSMPGSWHVFFKNITDIALAAPYFAITAIGYLTLRFSGKLENLRNWLGVFFCTLLATGLVINLLKMTIGRRRPLDSAGYDPHIFDPFNIHWDFHSLPSGHSQVGWTVATALAIRFPRFMPIFFTFAAILSLSRVAITVHFVSDVIAGAAIGYVMAQYLFRRYHRKGDA